MISENITKQQFIIEVLQRDLNNIYKAQLGIARQNIYVEGKELKVKRKHTKKIGVRSGALLKSLENPDFVIQASGEKFVVSAGIVLHMRFIDMKKYGNRRIYSRQVWGILYNNALRDIRSGYGQELYDVVKAALHEAFGEEHGSSSRSRKKSYPHVKGRES